MSTKLRRRKNFKKRFFLYVLFLAVVACGAFFLNTFSASKGPLFISPLGKVNVDLNKVRKALIDKNISFSTVSLSDYSYLIILQNNEQIRISESKDIVKQITSLQRILNQLTIEGKSFKSIDFRFTEPIISF